MRDAERALGWSARAGKLVLGLALDRLWPISTDSPQPPGKCLVTTRIRSSPGTRKQEAAFNPLKEKVRCDFRSLPPPVFWPLAPFHRRCPKRQQSGSPPNRPTPPRPTAITQP